MATSHLSEAIQYLRAVVPPQDGEGPADAQLLRDYLDRGDELALVALVRRHGPMVWGVCRRVLGNHHDAEDSFQATFLVFVRRAASIASPELLANWLHGVAHQTALKARSMAARRQARERQVNQMPEPAVADQPLRPDLQPLIDEEVSQLPERYRAVIVLCGLQGKTRKEAAQQLGVPEGTVAGWLARARDMLAGRLARHGVALAGAALLAVLAQNVASAGVPASLQSSTIKAAILFAAGQTVAGVISPTAIALTEGVLESMVVSKTKIVTALLLLVLILGVGVGLLRTPAQPPAPEKPSADPAPAEKKAGPRVKWEYKAIGPDDVKKLAPRGSKDKLTDGMNVLGEQGWELAAVQPADPNVIKEFGTAPPVYVFKRPK